MNIFNSSCLWKEGEVIMLSLFYPCLYFPNFLQWAKCINYCLKYKGFHLVTSQSCLYWLRSGLCPPCLPPLAFVEIHVSIQHILIVFWGYGRDQDKAPTLLRSTSGVTIQTSDCHLSPRLSSEPVCGAQHIELPLPVWNCPLVLFLPFCLPPTLSRFLALYVESVPRGFVLSPFTSFSVAGVLFIPRFWIRNGRSVQVWAEAAAQDAGEGGKRWYQWLSRTWMRVAFEVWHLWSLHSRCTLCGPCVGVLAYVWSKIWAPWPITGSNLEERMNEYMNGWMT